MNDMNKVVDRFLKIVDRFMLEMHLKQTKNSKVYGDRRHKIHLQK